LTNFKADSKQDIDLSSFDINAICYDIDMSKYIENIAVPFFISKFYGKKSTAMMEICPLRHNR
jgi:hypothetical protein